MRALVQRVERAEVRVDGAVVGEVGTGLCVFVGGTHEDGEAEADRLVTKLAGLRIMDDDYGVMNHSVVDVNGEVLMVSQSRFAEIQPKVVVPPGVPRPRWTTPSR